MNAPPVKTCPQCGNTYDMEQRFCPRDGTTLRAPPGSDIVGSVLADRYLIIKRLGEGGMGQVYLAEHVKMKRKSAVKVLHQGMVHDPDAIARFNREASNASQITHPNVAAIYDFGETPDGLVYLAMEFVDGEPLTATIERQGALPAVRAAEIVRQTADALEAAHEIGIVHRDLKPDNIMIARGKMGEDVVKVVDFGIAKAMHGEDQKVTKTGLAIGTPEYMSPEQLGGDQLDSRTDIYSLGLVAFCMFTGQLPFPAVTSREALIMRLTEKPSTLSDIKSDVAWPEELQWVMDRALANHPGDRYQYVSQFGRDLVKAVSAMPEAALTQQGTISISPVPVIPGKTEARDLGGGRAAKKDTPVIAEEITAPVGGAEPSTGKRVGLAFAALALIAAAGGGYWYVSHQKATVATNVKVDSAVVATKDTTPVAASADTAHHDTTAVAAATPDSAKPAPAVDSAAGKTAEKAPPPPANLEDLLDPIREDIRTGKDRMNQGQYEGATVRFGAATDALAPLLRKYPHVPELTRLKKQIEDAATANHTACEAERDDAIARGRQAPDCP